MSKKESLFSKKNVKLIKDPLLDNNPITIQVLGICSALAITVQVEQAFIMSISVLFVLVFAELFISLLRNVIPDKIRIIVQLVIVAFLVILVNEVLKAYAFEVYQKLSVFVGLIITNCIIMGRLEAFALGNKPGPSIMDGVGNSLGYGFILVLIGFVREVFGSGAISFPGFGQYKFIPQSWFDAGYMNNNLMILPPMALIITGVIIWVQRSKNRALIEEH